MSHRVPDNYFNNLPDRIRERINDLKDELSENAPILSSIDKDTIYKVPEYYFSGLSSQLVSARSKTRNLRLSMYRIAIAASLALLIAFGVDSVFKIDNQTEQSFAEAEVLDYYMDNIDELDYALIADMNIEELDLDIRIAEDISDEELELYVSDILDEFSAEELYNTIESLN